VKIHQ